MEAGSLAALRRRRELLGARRDGQGAGRYPRDATRPSDAAAKLADGRRCSPPTRRVGWVETHLRPLAGLDADETTSDRGEAFAAWRRFFEALAEQRPLVLVFEDLHWADDGLLDFVDHLVDWLTDVPLLVVCTARPELLYAAPGVGWGQGERDDVSLSPLSDDETATLVHELLEQSVLPAEVQSALLERAGGNPLYAEEFVRMFVAGSATAALAARHRAAAPESVQGIIAARLDGLPREDKELFQDAAVVGKVFWSGALAEIGGRERAVVEERLHALERQRARPPRAPELGRGRERVRLPAPARPRRRLRAIPGPTARRAHRRAAEWIEALGRPEDHADLLAHHYLSALELARAAGVMQGALAGSAANALRRAGDRAFGLNAFASAARFYDEALELWPATRRREPSSSSDWAARCHRAADERRIRGARGGAGCLHLALADPETSGRGDGLDRRAPLDERQSRRVWSFRRGGGARRGLAAVT